MAKKGLGKGLDALIKNNPGANEEVLISTGLGLHNVQVAKDIYTAINCFVKSRYAFVIMDLFVSTEQEGYTLLHETKKIITKSNMDTKIIVITASAKAENKIKCLNGGADYFIKKDAGWQDEIVRLVKNTIGEDSQKELPDNA